MRSWPAAAANPTICMPAAAYATFVIAPGQRALSTVSIAPNIPAKCTGSGRRRRNSCRMFAKQRSAWSQSGCAVCPPGLRRRKSAGPARIAASRFHGTVMPAPHAGARLQHTGCPGGGSFCAVSYCPWPTAKERRKVRGEVRTTAEISTGSVVESKRPDRTGERSKVIKKIQLIKYSAG